MVTNQNAGVSLPSTASRIPGQGRLVRSLRSLLRRVERYGVHRARTVDEHTWACAVADGLERVYSLALTSASARASLHVADRRASVSHKGRM